MATPQFALPANPDESIDARAARMGFASAEEYVSHLIAIEGEREELLAATHRAMAQAEAANKAKDEFLSALSHELRSPLQAVLGWTQLIRAGMDPDRAEKGLEIIERNVRQQARLIEDLLDFSGMIAGRTTIGKSPIDLSGVVHKAIDEKLPEAKAKSIAFEFDSNSFGTIVFGDPDRLAQVFANLLSNAIKFTPRGGRISVDCREEEREAVIRITDTGQGITPEFVPHLFERFSQADSSTIRRHGGLGLGLAIARHLLALHDGTVTATSDGAGKGATFTVVLPLAIPETMKADDEPRSGRSVVSLRGVKILLVEDEDDAREALVFLLQESGAQVIATASAPEALRAFKEYCPAILLSDISMPDEDGYSLLAKIRATEVGSAHRLRAIALTGHADQRVRALTAGFDAHIAKPIDMQSLTRTISRLAGAASKLG